MDESFLRMTNIDTALIDGSAVIEDKGINYALVGYGVASKLGLYLESENPLTVYIPKRGSIKSLNINSTFQFKQITPSGIFFINPEFDEKYIIVPIRFIQDALKYDDQITAIELTISNKDDLLPIQSKISSLIGKGYKVENRYETDALLYKTNQAEKWITFMILSFILIIAAFNILSSLTILIIDKTEDIKVLRSLGASKSLIKRIFFTEGILINLIGAGGGLLIGTIICLLQQHVGILKLGGGIVEYYPVEIRPFDFILISITVIIIGGLSSYFPVKLLTRKLL